MGTDCDRTDHGFEIRFDKTVRLTLDDVTFTAWGERHGLATGGLDVGPVESTPNHDEVGAHDELTWLCTTRSVRQPVQFRLTARCYQTEPVVMVELQPELNRPVFGTEECASVRIAPLPDCRQAVQVHQRVNEYGRDAVGSWWSQARFCADPTRDNPWDWGLFCGWRTADGTHLALVPLRGGGAVSRLRGEGDGLSVVSSGWCGQHLYRRLPLFVLAADTTPSGAVHRALRAAAGLSHWSFRLREDKIVCEPFDTLGWATWGALGRDLSEWRVTEAVVELRNLGVPVNWVSLDEGWQQVNRAQQLVDFDADPARFPAGLGELVRRLQGEGGVRHVGVWLTLQGAWGGLAPNSPAGRTDRAISATDGSLVPHPGPEGEAFWRELFEQLRYAGIDLARIDNQGSTRNLYLGRLALDEAVGGVIEQVERAANGAGVDLVGSMSHHPECLFHYSGTNTVRVAADIVPDDRRAAKLHLTHAVHVGHWLSEIAWPDCDAFPSTHVAARAFAVVSALSGGPVCLADAPGAHDLDLIARLHLDDGRLLQPEAPATTPAGRWYDDPLTGGRPLILTAPAARVPRRDPAVGLSDWRSYPQALMIGLVNVSLDGQPVRCDLRPAELALEPAPRYAVMSHFGGRAWVVEPDGVLELVLDELQAEVLTVAPVFDGHAMLGLTNKLLGACGCIWDNDHVISVPEPGDVLLYDETGRLAVSVDYAPYRMALEGRPLERGTARRDGALVWVGADSTVFRMEPPP